MKRISVLLCFCFLVFGFSASAEAPLYVDSTFLRNGEVYLSVSGFPEAQAGKNAIYRLNSPQQDIPVASFPQNLIPSQVRDFTVDVDRNIFALGDPDTSTIGDDFMFKRQVLDDSALLEPCGTWTHDERSGVAATDYDISNVTDDISDWGCHAFIHMDHRSPLRYPDRWGYDEDIYRTIEDGSVDSRTVRAGWNGHTTWGENSFWYNCPTNGWQIHEGEGFNAVRPLPASAPSNPVDYLPSGFEDDNLILPYYSGKDWYYVPNGAWYSSWKARWCCGTDGFVRITGGPWAQNHNSSGGTRGIGHVGVDFYYQVFADKASGTQYDWRLVEWNPDETFNVYEQNDSDDGIFATTYAMSVQRASLAGCLDGCGFEADEDEIDATDMIFDAAFMTYTEDGEPRVRTYAYSRADGTGNYSIDVSDGFTNYHALGSPVGIDTYDTEWIGLSLAPGNQDYLYYFGTSQIQEWLSETTYADAEIIAVSVSNQWNEQGGIIFAYDEESGNIIEFTLDSSTASGTLDTYDTIDLSEILTTIGADKDSPIDDIAVDGFGNVFIALTYPSPDPEFNAPEALGLTYNDAIDYSYTEHPESGDGLGEFEFVVDYRKSVWRISSIGQLPTEVGQVQIGTRRYTRSVTMPVIAWELIDALTLPADINSIIDDHATYQGHYTGENVEWGLFSGHMAVINAPIPPPVYSIYGKNSYLDIIGHYKLGAVPSYDGFSTHQNNDLHNSNIIDLGELSFFQVENYPNPTTQRTHDPRVNPDYDGDGRAGGFVSTTKDVRYHWKVWHLTDFRDNVLLGLSEKALEDAGVLSVIPSHLRSTVEPEVHSGDSWEYQTAIFPVFPGRYIVSVKAYYDWYNYNDLKINESVSDIDRVFHGNALAIPSCNKSGWEGVGYDPGHASTTERLAEVIDSIITDDQLDRLNKELNTIYYRETGIEPADDDEPVITVSRSDIVSYLEDYYKNNDPEDYQFWAVQGVIAAGDPPPPPVSSHTARIQRCNPGASNPPVENANWFPKDNAMLPDIGFHGIMKGYEYRWRIDPASQAVFFDTLKDGSDYYWEIANRLTDPDDELFIDFDGAEFEANENDLSWAGLDITAYIEYPYPDGVASNTDKRYIPLDLISTIYDEEENATFTYLTIPQGILPPTDPYVATLSIQMSGRLQYFMKNVAQPGSQRLITAIIPYSITGSTNIMVIDTEAPEIIFSETNANALFAETGTYLGDSSENEVSSISFVLKDDNPWEGFYGISPHALAAAENIELNASYTQAIASDTADNCASVNLLPVFDPDNRFIRLSFDSVSSTDTGIDFVCGSSAHYGPAWATAPEGIDDGNVEVVSVALIDETGENEFYSNFNVSQPIDKLGPGGGSLSISPWYANNTPGYMPLKLHIEASDSSGNLMDLRELNVRLHIRDNIRPNPFGIVKELKDLNDTRLLDMVCSGGTDDTFVGGSGASGGGSLDYASEFISNLSFGRFIDEQDQAVWNSDPRDDGLVAKHDDEHHAGSYSLYALPQTSSAIIKLDSDYVGAGILTSVAPGYIVIEDNVEVIFTAGATDNAGSAVATLTFKYFDIMGVEQSGDVARAIFREGDSVPFPMLIPVTIEAADNAKNFDTCEGYTINDQGIINWNDLTEGSSNPNTRVLETVVPVYGSELDIRTIERGIRPR